MKDELEELKKKITVLRLVRLTKKGFERHDVLTTKGYEKEALKKVQRGKRRFWILIVKSSRKCPKCNRNLEDWGIYNTKDGLKRVLKCEKCNHVELENATIDDLIQMIKTRT